MVYPGKPELQSSKPWFVIEAVTQLEDELLQPGWRAFEWGCGGSTLWLSQWCASVISLEHDPDWYSQMRDDVQRWGIDNVELKLADLGGLYEGYIQRYPANFFDLILVDGPNRAACLTNAITRLRTGGILVLDDAQREQYQAAIAEHLIEWQRWDRRISS